MHDGQRRLQALSDVHFLQPGLVHVGIFFDGLDKVGDARGAVLELVSDALHFQKRSKAHQFRAERSAPPIPVTKLPRCASVTFASAKKRRELPGIGDVARPSAKPELLLLARRAFRNSSLNWGGFRDARISSSRFASSAQFSGPMVEVRPTSRSRASQSRSARRNGAPHDAGLFSSCARPAESLPSAASFSRSWLTIGEASHAIGQHPDQALR